MVVVSPATPTVGEKLETVGVPLLALMTTDCVLVAVPAGDVTEMVPVVAPDGTVVTICVAVDDVTVAAVLLNYTVFCPGVVLNPVPEIVTVVPTGPFIGDTAITDTVDELYRAMERRFPTASYKYTAVSAAGSITPMSRPTASYTYSIGCCARAATEITRIPRRVTADTSGRTRAIIAAMPLAFSASLAFNARGSPRPRVIRGRVIVVVSLAK